MRNIKTAVSFRVPSWNYCNHDAAPMSSKIPKTTCRFCIKTKNGYCCVLHDSLLQSDANFIYKTPKCINATAGFAATVEEPAPITDPKIIMRETLRVYTKELNSLLSQGYPRQLAETLATKQTLED